MPRQREMTTQRGMRGKLAAGAAGALSLVFLLSGCAPLPPGPAKGAAANRMIVWTSVTEMIGATDADLDKWRNMGIGGFMVDRGYLPGLGGAAEAQRPYQDWLRSADIVARVHARGMKLYMGTKLTDYYTGTAAPGTVGPLGDWFDNANWSNTILPAFATWAAEAHALGFDGLNFDSEAYDRAVAWDGWNQAPGHTEQQVRAEVTTRGSQMMTALLSGFPAVDLMDYDTYLFPGAWNAWVQHVVNHAPWPGYAESVDINWWDGMTRVLGYANIRFTDATFYKGPNCSCGETFDSALSWNANSFAAIMSQDFSNWAYAADRVSVTPMTWIDGNYPNEGTWSLPRGGAYVANQLQEYRKWGEDGVQVDFAFAGLKGFDYTPYVPALRASAQPGIVDTTPPTIKVTGLGSTLSGTAHDDFAVRVVRWAANGQSGAARLTYQVLTGSPAVGTYQMNWTANVPLNHGANRVTLLVEDIHGLIAATTVTVNVP